MTSQIFKELDGGHVAHTAATKALVQVPLLNQWIGMVLEEIWPSTTRVRFSELESAPASHAHIFIDR